MRTICPAIRAGLPTLFLALTLAAPVAHAQFSLSNRRAPSFSLSDSNMQQHDILDFRGKWLLLDFMRTDCPHCKMLSKVLEAVKIRYAGKVALLSIVLSPPENASTVDKYIAENRVTSPIVFDMGQVAISYFRATPAHPSFDTPHLFAIDPNGLIVHDWTQTGVEEPGFMPQLDGILSGRK